MIPEAETQMLKTVTPQLIADTIAMIPGEWLTGQDSDISQDEARHVYRTFLTDRLKASPIFTKHAIDARNAII